MSKLDTIGEATASAIPLIIGVELVASAIKNSSFWAAIAGFIWLIGYNMLQAILRSRR